MSDQRERESHAVRRVRPDALRPVRGLGEPQQAYRNFQKDIPIPCLPVLYSFGPRVEWCTCFVIWCANECGYIDAGVIPKFAGCVTGSQWFKERGLWQDKDYEPRLDD